MQHLTGTLPFKDHWSHDLHDLAEGSQMFFTIYKFWEREVESNHGCSDENFGLNHWVMLPRSNSLFLYFVLLVRHVPYNTWKFPLKDLVFLMYVVTGWNSVSTALEHRSHRVCTTCAQLRHSFATASPQHRHTKNTTTTQRIHFTNITVCGNILNITNM